MNNYIIGLLAADGSTRSWKKKDGNISYNCVLEMKDNDAIDYVSKECNGSFGIRERFICGKDRISYTTHLGVDVMNGVGHLLENNKKELFNYVKSLNNYEQFEVMSGMFDGDGCFSANGGVLRICYVANSKDGLDDIFEFICDENDINFSKYHDKRGAGAYNYQIKRSDNKKFCSLYLLSEGYRLKRKKEKIMKFYNIA